MRRSLILVALAATAACAPPPGTRRPEPATVLFLTDFGVKDGAVAVCKGVMWDIEPRLRIVDLTHEVPAYDIETAAEVLEQSVPFYPAGAVAVAVVDPGVGSERKSVAILTKKGHLLVGPDNGIFTLVLETEGLDRAVELREKRFFRRGDSSFTFHGRDVFAPVAAHLAAGAALDELGPPVVPMRLDLRPARKVDGGISGTVRYIEDPYGNVVTDIPEALLGSVGAHVGDTLEVRVGVGGGSRALRLPWRRTFSDVPRGQPLAVMHSRDLLSLSINQGDFATKFGVKRKDPVSLRRVP